MLIFYPRRDARLRGNMSKRFKDETGEQYRHPESIVDLTPESAIHPSPHHLKHNVQGAEGGPTPLSVEETIEVLGEIDKLNAQIEELKRKNQELMRELEAKNGEASQPQGGDPVEQGKPDESVLTQTNEAKDKEIAELKDKYLRALAEHENARRRIRQQSEDSIKRQKENLLHDLLPIVDNLERAVEASKGKTDSKSIIEGVQMVLASLMDFLKANNVRPMASVGEPFDPNKHEAADHVPHSAHPPNTVVSEFHRGYQINDKVLRPARVVVSKGDSDDKGPKVE
jgi:molecular chaperone GrpE